jgi:hypothetical protein
MSGRSESGDSDPTQRHDHDAVDNELDGASMPERSTPPGKATLSWRLKGWLAAVGAAVALVTGIVGLRDEMRRLAKQVRRARTSLAQCNVLLDSANQTLGPSQHQLARLKSLESPSDRIAIHRSAEVAWDDVVMRLRWYAQRLDAASGRRDVVTIVDRLPTMRRVLGDDYVTRLAGLTELGGGRCRLDPQFVPPVLMLSVIKLRL